MCLARESYLINYYDFWFDDCGHVAGNRELIITIQNDYFC